MVGQLAQTGISATDTIMAGRYAAVDLAAIGIAASFWLPIFLFFVGLFMATTTLVAHCFGAGDMVAVRRQFQQSVWLAIFIMLPGVVLMNSVGGAVSLLGVEPEVARITDDYLVYLSAGLPAALLFLCLRGLSDGAGYTTLVMRVFLAGFVINIPMNYLFIYGRLGAPELGGAGCGLATAVVLWCQLLLLLALVYWQPRLRKARLWHHWRAPALHTISQLLKLGLPIGLTLVAEISIFAVIAIVIAPLGTEVLAGHQIAMNVTSICFMLPMSISIAITIATGQYLGAGKLQLARITALTGASLALLTAMATLTLLMGWRYQVASVYTDDVAVITVAGGLLIYAAMYQIPDALQVSAIGGLRAYKDARVPFLLALLGFWVITMPIGISLSRGLMGFDAMGADGMWIGLVIGLGSAALLQSLRFVWVAWFVPRSVAGTGLV
jgi:MATE family multidrug resistance protein